MTTFNAREAAHALLDEAFFRCLHPDHNKDCDQTTASLQRAYDAGQADAFARGFAAGLARAEEIAREAPYAGARIWIFDALARERTSPAAAPVEPPKETTP